MKKLLFFVAMAAIIAIQSAAQPQIMVMRSAFPRWNQNLKKDTLFGAYCYREINGQISGVTREKTAFDYLPLRENEKMVYYVLADQCTASIKLNLHTEKKVQPMINVKIIEVNTGKVICDKTVKAKFKGGAESCYVMQTTDLPSKSWYRIELTAQDWLTINSIDSFVFEHDGANSISPSPIFMAPSVHLNGWESTDVNAPKGEAYDWAYLEVMLPKKFERKNTYVMSLGVLSGYMGMQTVDDKNNQQYKHRVVFSMWDKGNTDEDPNVPEYMRSGALDNSDNVEIKRFGGEGTGTRSMIYDSHWECDNWVQFITTCRPERINIPVKDASGKVTMMEYDNTLVSAWYKQAGDTEWHYLSTLREASRNHYMADWYSFLENFTDDGGEFYRRAYYRNGFFHSLTDNKWYSRNKVGFGHTQGSKEHPRYDYGHGATSQYANCFYLEQGGYTLTANDSARTVPLASDFTPVDTINLSALWNRVEQAICKENTREMDRRIAAASEASDKLGAFKALAKEYIDNAGRFGYYAKEDLRDLETVYKGGETTDAAGLAMYLREMARFSMPLKQGKPIKLEHLGSTHAYQMLLDNGSTLKASGSAIGYATDGLATDQTYNWQIVRKGSTDKFTICNMQTKQYLDPSASGQLSSSPVEVSVAVRNDDKGFVISNGGKSIECNLLDNYYVKHIK